jgi:hypothetical protein
MLLRDLQYLLGNVYGIDLSADVRDFLITDPIVVKALENNADYRDTDEKLLIRQDENADELAISLYLDSDLLQRLAALDPRHKLNDSNLADFCTVLEGVSHFNYLIWNATADKSVTLMELELQAEVDKYIGARVLLQRQPDSELGISLYARLFDDPQFHETLSPEELSRYRAASDYAGRYCRSLELRYAHVGARMQQELRTFFRLPQPAKVSHIHSASFA